MWGLYFLCAKEATGLGSRDLSYALFSTLPNEPGFTPKLPTRGKIQRLEHNRLLAETVLGEVLLARLLIFQKFIDRMESHLNSNGIPIVYPNFDPFIERWLQLQLHPTMLSPFYQGDIFVDLTSVIHAAKPDATVLQVMIYNIASTLFPKINSSIHGSHGGDIFLVLDEAQEAGLAMKTAFRSEKQTTKARPVLRELITAWSNQLCYPVKPSREEELVDLPVTLVVTGTGMSLDDMRQALYSSTVVKEDTCQQYQDMGGFEEKEQQVAYVQKYVPKEILDHPVGVVLLDRMWYWLRGRYRFTAEFLAFLIENGYKQPNALLDRFICNLTELAPSDCPQDIIQMEDDPNSGLFGPMAFQRSPSNIPFNWKILLTDRSKTLNMIRDLTWKYVVTSGLENFLGGTDSEMVQYGFGRIPHVRIQNPDQLPNNDKSAAAVDETLVLWGCAAWLNNTMSRDSDDDEESQGDGQPSSLAKNTNTLYWYLARKFETNEGGHSWFEDYLMYYFCLAFSNPRRVHTLGDIFHIMGPCAGALRQKKATLVSIYVPEDGQRSAQRYVPTLFDEYGQFLCCGGNLGDRSTGNNVAHKWLAHHDRAAFCFPDKAMGPDIIFVLELDRGSYIWVMVQAKRCGVQKYLPRKTLRSAIRSVTPWSYFMDQTVRKKFSAGKTQPSDYKETAHKNQVMANQKTLKLLDELPGRDTTLAGKHSVLRVVASWSAISCQWKHLGKTRPRTEPLEDEGGDTEMQEEDDEEDDEGGDDDDSSPTEGSEEVDPDEDSHPLATLNFRKLRELTGNIPPDHKLDSWKASQARIQMTNRNHKDGKLVNKTGQKPPKTRKRSGKRGGIQAKEVVNQPTKTAASNPVRRSARRSG
ncbi:hypothetical protein VNI00_003670 [Paramarasmius palmivorus]|uniref:Helicase ATP-binding domain-containing protein n=1 Tax=Paramarasmius palmivorus TaxID=297713 RepID=A0AAW0DP23_9AGAR